MYIKTPPKLGNCAGNISEASGIAKQWRRVFFKRDRH